MTHNKRIEPVGINRGKLRGLVAVALRVFTNVANSNCNETIYYSELFGAIFDLFYAPTGCTYDEFLDEMRILFKDIINEKDMEDL
ncbi:MAG: hypothetical protein ACTSVW_06725 [Candidatus Njordarchaeales archaeon]